MPPFAQKIYSGTCIDFLGDVNDGEKNDALFEYKPCPGISLLHSDIYYPDDLHESDGRKYDPTAGRFLNVGNQ